MPAKGVVKPENFRKDQVYFYQLFRYLNLISETGEANAGYSDRRIRLFSPGLSLWSAFSYYSKPYHAFCQMRLNMSC